MLKIIFAFVLVPCTLAAVLPGFIKPCQRTDNDKELGDCIVQHASEAIAGVVKGDKKFKLRALDPLYIPELQVHNEGNLNLDLKKINLYGLSKAELVSANVDSTAKRYNLTFHVNEVTLDGIYKVDGKILVLPIRGEGKFDAAFTDATVNYGFDYKLEQINGKNYMVPFNKAMGLDIKGSSYKLENLFNGDKRLGEEMHVFLNQNHEVLLEILQPAMLQVLKQISDEAIEKIIAKVPEAELFE